MPPRRAVELRVGGQTYRVVATDNDGQVQHLAGLVDQKFLEVVPQGQGRGMTAQQAMFLTALALAQELEEERARAAVLEAERDRAMTLTTRAKEVVGRLLSRVDSVLATVPSAAGGGPSAQADRAVGEERAARAPATTGASREAGHAPAGSRTTLTASDLGLTDPRPPDLETAEPLFEAPDADRVQGAPEPRPLRPREGDREAAFRPSPPRGGLRLVRQSSPSEDDR